MFVVFYNLEAPHQDEKSIQGLLTPIPGFWGKWLMFFPSLCPLYLKSHGDKAKFLVTEKKKSLLPFLKWRESEMWGTAHGGDSFHCLGRLRSRSS